MSGVIVSVNSRCVVLLTKKQRFYKGKKTKIILSATKVKIPQYKGKLHCGCGKLLLLCAAV